MTPKGTLIKCGNMIQELARNADFIEDKAKFEKLASDIDHMIITL